MRRADLWKIKAKSGTSPSPVHMSLESRLNKLRKSAAKKKSSTSPGRKTRPIVIDSDDDSDSDEGAAASKTATPDPEDTLAPPPESYTKAEIKHFKRMAKTIRDFDESRGHSAAPRPSVHRELSTQVQRTRGSRLCRRSGRDYRRKKLKMPVKNSSMT